MKLCTVIVVIFLVVLGTVAKDSKKRAPTCQKYDGLNSEMHRVLVKLLKHHRFKVLLKRSCKYAVRSKYFVGRKPWYGLYRDGDVVISAFSSGKLLPTGELAVEVPRMLSHLDEEDFTVIYYACTRNGRRKKHHRFVCALGTKDMI